jgi:hypothetical protein
LHHPAALNGAHRDRVQHCSFLPPRHGRQLGCEIVFGPGQLRRKARRVRWSARCDGPDRYEVCAPYRLLTRLRKASDDRADFGGGEAAQWALGIIAAGITWQGVRPRVRRTQLCCVYTPTGASGLIRTQESGVGFPRTWRRASLAGCVLASPFI